MKTILNGAVVVIATLCGTLAGAEPSITDDIGRYLHREMRERHIPGLQVAVVRSGAGGTTLPSIAGVKRQEHARDRPSAHSGFDGK